MRSVALFDSLAITDRLQSTYGNVMEGEIYLFGYLACLLSLYRRRPVADWGYGFTATSLGAPYAYEMAEAIEHLTRNGLMMRTQATMTIAQAGREMYEEILNLSMNSERKEFIDGACDSLLAMPVGMIREAISREPGLSRTKYLLAKRILLRACTKRVA